MEIFINASDRQVRKLYANATALLSASNAEGFGLPILEAIQYGSKLVLSDIPAHREVADTRALFFGVGNEFELIRALKSLSDTPRVQGPVVNVGTWTNSLNNILRQI